MMVTFQDMVELCRRCGVLLWHSSWLCQELKVLFPVTAQPSES